jgi:N-acetylglucosamine repressor
MQVPAKATHRQTRQYNRRLVLRTLYDFGPTSRAEVARLTGLTRTTVSDAVAELIATGMAHEVGRGPSSGGKTPILVAVIDDARHVIGLDLGDGVFAGALVNLRGAVHTRLELPLEGRDGDDALALVYRLVDDLLAISDGPLLGIGVGTPGVVDTGTGTIRWAVNLQWHDLPLGRLLEERYGVPTNVANDSQAAALAEFAFGGDGPRHPNLVAIRAGGGIGAGIVIGGSLYQGDGSGAGEIGHVVVVDDGAACRCGRFGCLETVASGPAIVAHARAEGLDVDSLGGVRDALVAGDERVLSVVRFAGRYLGRAVAGLVGTLDIQDIAIHGPVTILGEPWFEAVRDEATRRALPLLADGLTIRLARLGADEVVLGASALLMTRELGLGLMR